MRGGSNDWCHSCGRHRGATDSGQWPWWLFDLPTTLPDFMKTPQSIRVLVKIGDDIVADEVPDRYDNTVVINIDSDALMRAMLRKLPEHIRLRAPLPLQEEQQEEEQQEES